MILRPILRPVLSDQLVGHFGPTTTPDKALLYVDASRSMDLKPVTYNGKYLVVKNV